MPFSALFGMPQPRVAIRLARDRRVLDLPDLGDDLDQAVEVDGGARPAQESLDQGPQRGRGRRGADDRVIEDGAGISTHRFPAWSPQFLD